MIEDGKLVECGTHPELLAIPDGERGHGTILLFDSDDGALQNEAQAWEAFGKAAGGRRRDGPLRLPVSGRSRRRTKQRERRATSLRDGHIRVR